MIDTRYPLIVGGAPVDDRGDYATLVASADPLIAVDGGAGLCFALGRVPDIVIGDMDSVSADDLDRLRAEDVLLVPLDPHKDISDLAAALGYCDAQGIADIVITAVTGGRVDHQLAVIGTIARHVALNPIVREPSTMYRFLDAEISPYIVLELEPGAVISVIPVLGSANVTLQGMRYPLDHAEMPILGDLGLSNVVEAQGPSVTVHRGLVVLIVPSKVF